MSYYVEWFKDSNLVWRFQEYFGVCKVAKASSRKSRDHSRSSSGSSGFQNGGCNNQWNVVGSSTLTEEGGEFVDEADDIDNLGDNGFLSCSPLLKKRIQERDLDDLASSLHNAGLSSDSGLEETLSESDENGSHALTSAEKYIITNKFWFYLFSFGTALGDEMFYASFFPFWFWNIDGAVGRRVVMVWVAIMYIGQGLKDIICWPRPFCPPAIRLEKKWALEFGMPSTHAMVGLGVPYSVLYYTMHRYEYPVYLGVILSFVWCVVVCSSRIYFGMHTVLDIIGGLLLTVILLSVFLPLLDSLDNFQLTHIYAPIAVIGLILLMVILYPSGKRWTPARGDTTIILGVGAGCSFGSWLNYQLGIIRGPPIPPPYKILWPTYEMIGLTLLRTCIGILIVVATRAFFKSVSYIMACWIFRLDPKDVENKKKIAVELSCKFFTYAVIGFNAIYFSPAVFRFLNIERVTMYTEV